MISNTYNSLTYEELLSNFSTDSWKALTPIERLDICQEVANRYSAEHETPIIEVTTAKMDGATYGYQSGNKVFLNQSLIEDLSFTTSKTDDYGDPVLDENGNKIFEKTLAPAPSWNTLDTVIHETTHYIQQEEGRMPYTYMSPETDWNLYRIQELEKEAYNAGEKYTTEAIKIVEASTKKIDPDKQEYIESITYNSYVDALERSAFNYNDPNIKTTLDNVIYNRDHYIMPNNPSQSYLLINQAIDNQEYNYLNEKNISQTIKEDTDNTNSPTNNSKSSTSTNDFCISNNEYGIDDSIIYSNVSESYGISYEETEEYVTDIDYGINNGTYNMPDSISPDLPDNGEYIDNDNDFNYDDD